MLPSQERSVPIMLRPSRVRTVTRSGGGCQDDAEGEGWKRARVGAAEIGVGADREKQGEDPGNMRGLRGIKNILLR